MPTYNENLFNKTLQREMAFGRYENGVNRRVLAFLKKQQEITNDMILRSYNSSDLTQKRLRLIRKNLRARQKIIKRLLESKVRKEVNTYALSEARFLKEIAGEINSSGVIINTTIPTQDQLSAAIYNKPYDGQNFQTWFNNLSTYRLAQITKAVNTAFVQGEPLEAMRRRLFANSRTETHQVRALLRTTMTHTRTTAREVWAENNDFTFRRYTAILDVRTTYICATLDGEVYNSQKDNYPAIPQHINCRSTYIFVPNPNEIRGERIEVKSPERSKREHQRQIREIARQDKIPYLKAREKWARDNIGRVPAKTSYKDWFDNRSAKFQRSYLGHTRYNAYKAGKLDLADLVDSQTARPLTITELSALGKL